MKNMKKLIFLIPFVSIGIIVLTNQSCYYDNEVDLYPTGSTTTCDTTNAKFAAFVSPLIASKCATSGCHTATSLAGNVNLSNYTTIKNYIIGNKVRFLGSIKHTSGYSQMPQGDTKLATCDIQKIEIWINNGLINN